MNLFKVGKKAVSSALAAFKTIDSLILNHGTLEPVKRIADSTASEWRSAFDVNFFSLISFVSSCFFLVTSSPDTLDRSNPLSQHFAPPTAP
jgi:NAD(P)-dependent dehydrogenase (short-subunit alcohol dehydrogenase family)